MTIKRYKKKKRCVMAELGAMWLLINNVQVAKSYRDRHAAARYELATSKYQLEDDQTIFTSHKLVVTVTTTAERSISRGSGRL